MGIGHVMRCLTLAESLRERGIGTLFVCRDHPGNMADYLRQRSFDCTLLPRSAAVPGPVIDADYGSWVGATQALDAEQTIQALGGVRPDWLIVDHYGLDGAWEGRLRSHAKNLLVIDDLANRRHDCDILVDQNFTTAAHDRYRGLIPANCRTLYGPHFAMLSPEYRRRRSGLSPRGVVHRILIFFGGSDPLNLTGMAIEALRDPEFRDLEIDVVVGVNNPHRQALEESAHARPRTRLHGPQPHLAELMAKADLSIGAGGVTTWERMCLGLPSIVVSIAENQVPACQSMAEAGLIVYAGHHRVVGVSDLIATIRRAVGETDVLAEMSSRGQRTVDGWGAQRIVESMQPTAKDLLRMRRAGADDVFQFFMWANDPDVRAQSILGQPISFDGHQKWFAERLRSPHSHLFVMQAGELPVGQIRFDREGNEERIDYSIDKYFRGRGWAYRLVELGMSQVPPRPGLVFRAEVKDSNLPSHTVFSRLGFAALPSEHINGISIFRFNPFPPATMGDPTCE
jgi:UDP-2,4-diacetamido-2,4,6-trideoxy-beta-L-altropyranose hydrolase